MNAPLTYTPAYFGLFASLWLALLCNAFLDIQYGRFGFEAFFWAAIHGWTLRVAWLQRGVSSDSGRLKQKWLLVIALILFVIFFMPIWGIPRAGLYLLGMLQAAQNCITTTRRQLHLGLLVSAVMVMFAAAHYRADWTMLFYLLPYIVAVVFTLVSEQISRRAQSLREHSLQDAGSVGQGMAIGAATALILGLATLFYSVTPQVSWPYLFSQYGQLGNLGRFGESTGTESAGQAAGETGSQDAAGGDGAGSAAGKIVHPGAGNLSPWRGWPTSAQMRQSAARPGMPGWQSQAIGELADLSDAVMAALAPLTEAIDDMIQWLKEHRHAISSLLLALIGLMLFIALVFLLREAKAATWLRTRFDYCYLVVLQRHASGRDGASQFYRAMERLFVLAESPRSRMTNTREFLREATCLREEMHPAASALTSIFEQSRYGPMVPAKAQIDGMRKSYQTLYRLQKR